MKGRQGDQCYYLGSKKGKRLLAGKELVLAHHGTEQALWLVWGEIPGVVG